MDERPVEIAELAPSSFLPVPSLFPELEEAPEVPDPSRLGDVDEWGRSEHFRGVMRRLYQPIYKHWFRVEWEGLEKIPENGGALLVANHAGALPSDAPVVMHGIEEELGRPVYGLADYFFRTIPFVGTAWQRGGGVPARPENAYRLLREQGQLVLVFPEGVKGPSKKYTDRYQLRRFGRGGFVEIAMRAGVPVVPLAIIGSEETMPVVSRLPMVAKAIGTPYFPLTVNMLTMGPLGAVVPLPAKFKIRVLDPITFDAPRGLASYPRSQVMESTDRVRSTIQDAVYDMLRSRKSVWFG